MQQYDVQVFFLIDEVVDRNVHVLRISGVMRQTDVNDVKRNWQRYIREDGATGKY